MGSALVRYLILPVIPAHKILSTSEGKDWVLILTSSLRPLFTTVKASLLLSLILVDDTPQGSQLELFFFF